jgi:hypothetical protein
VNGDHPNHRPITRALIAEVQGALPNLQKALSDATEATASMPATSDQPLKPEDLASESD